MSRRLVIGLTGHPGSGKDSCAQVLTSHYFQSVAFADALRLEVARAWRVDVRMLTDRVTKEVPLPAFDIGVCNEPDFLRWAMQQRHCLLQPRSARWVLQHWGTDFRRVFCEDPDYWVRQVERWVLRMTGLGRLYFVITDVRMPNEAALVRRLGGKLVRVHRPDLPPMAADTAGHSSEAHGALEVDAVIHNDGSLEALEAEVLRVLAEVFPAEAADPIV
jgi:hypothetical protein